MTLEKLKELVEAAEEGEEFKLEDLQRVLRDLESGKLVSRLGKFLPKSALGLIATSGMIGLVAGLLTTVIYDRLVGKKGEEKEGS